MKMRNTLFLVALMLLALVVSACGTAATPTPKPTAPVPPTVPPTATLPPTPTPIPPTPVPPTATPIPPQATTTQQVNLRQGPGTDFAIAGKMPKGTSAVILGKNEDAKWFQIAFPDAAHPAWVASAFVTTTGTIDQLPVVAVAPPATATPGGPAPTKAAATAAPPASPPKGTLRFMTFDDGQKSYVLYNLVINPRGYSGDRLMGPKLADLRLSTNSAPFSLSPDGSRMAFVYGPNGLTDALRVTTPDGFQDIVSHGSTSTLGPGGILSPTWSPDGKWIAYVGLDNNYGTQYIYYINPDAKVEQKLLPARYNSTLNTGESFRGVAWGKTHLLFVSNYTNFYEIWRLNSDGSGPMQLTNDKRENGSPAWSPDGKQFAYYSKQADGSYQIMVWNADGAGQPRKLTSTGNNWTPAWSPDGNWIAFASTRGGNGRTDVYIMDKNGGNVQPLTDKFGAESMLPGSWR